MEPLLKASIDTGDTSFIIISTALVFLMTPGLALFYGGMVRKKNVLSTMMNSFIIIALVLIQWVLIGYTLAFGPDYGGFIGGLNHLALNGVGTGPNLDYAPTIPAYLFMAFQLMFAIITPAIISGSIAERMRFPAFIVFILLWVTLVYDPLAHWVWGVGGFLRTMGALDFAGGTVVHISSGVTGLVAALMLGKRKEFKKEPMAPHHIPMTVLGAGLLWFGWFGFNAGSALGANGLAATALITTAISAAAATLSWVIVEWLHHGKPTLLGATTGIIAGLVAITPAAGFVTPMAAIVIGLIGGVICYFAVAVVKGKLGYDDSLDAFGCHGVGGIWGAIATGLFATTSVNSAGANGLFYGNPAQLGIQVLSIVITITISASATFVILKVVNLVFRLRATSDEEETGLDLSMHGEDAYPDLLGLVQNHYHMTSNPSLAPLASLSPATPIPLSNPPSPMSSLSPVKHNSVTQTQFSGNLQKIEAIIRPDKLESIKEALSAYGINGLTVNQVIGYGKQLGHTQLYRGVEYSVHLVPKVKIEVVVLEQQTNKVVELIRSTARTGEIGDGKIFVFPIQTVVRIRTGEEGEAAV